MQLSFASIDNMLKTDPKFKDFRVSREHLINSISVLYQYFEGNSFYTNIFIDQLVDIWISYCKSSGMKGEEDTMVTKIVLLQESLSEAAAAGKDPKEIVLVEEEEDLNPALEEMAKACQI
jgi:hypothetical protein